jgi:DNA-binding transcriptional LysR family regulator
MARSDGFSGLSEFLAVARHASFRAAAAELGVTPAAVSQAVRTLEAKTGLVLFQRTTRRVGLTEAGEKLLARVRPAAAEIAEAFDALSDLRERPAGLLRLSVPRVAVPLVIEPVLAGFRRAYPDVAVDIDVNDAAVDLTANNLDAGIRIGELVESDMIAVRLTPDLRWSVLGTPSYFAARGRPRTPEELTHHECIRYRFLTAGSIYRWEFVRGGREFSVEVPGHVTVNDGALMMSLALKGMGLIYTADRFAARELAAGELETVLEEFLPTSPGLFLYFPARTQTQPKLRAFIDMLTASTKQRPHPTQTAGQRHRRERGARVSPGTGRRLRR